MGQEVIVACSDVALGGFAIGLGLGLWEYAVGGGGVIYLFCLVSFSCLRIWFGAARLSPTGRDTDYM